MSAHLQFAIRTNQYGLCAYLLHLRLRFIFRLFRPPIHPHEIWAHFFGSSLEDRLRYTPSDCFETFPFPDVTLSADGCSVVALPRGVPATSLSSPSGTLADAPTPTDGWVAAPALEAAGRACYDFRAALMVENDEGLTKTYNRFHDPYEDDSNIVKLRELHAAMDRAVLDAYGWTDLPTDCDFLLDYEIDDATWGRKKKPYRYRWPDSVRDELLARLIALNAERAAEEVRSGVKSDVSRRTSALPLGKSRYRPAAISRPDLMVAESKPLWPSSK